MIRLLPDSMLRTEQVPENKRTIPDINKGWRTNVICFHTAAVIGAIV